MAGASPRLFFQRLNQFDNTGPKKSRSEEKRGEKRRWTDKWPSCKEEIEEEIVGDVDKRKEEEEEEEDEGDRETKHRQNRSIRNWPTRIDFR